MVAQHVTRGAAIEVLLADDSTSDTELTLAALRETPVAERTFVARDGEEALDVIFSRGRFARYGGHDTLRLVILDLKLPKVGGLEVLRAVRGDISLRLLPVVILTSSSLDQDVHRAYTAGASSYVQKPVDFVRFRTVVTSIVHYWLTINQSPPAAGRDP